MISREFNDDLRKFFYSLIIVCTLIFFYKMTRYPNKSYGLIMIIILVGALFSVAVLGMATLFKPENKPLDNWYAMLVTYVDSWIFCLAIYHYSILKAFKAKFREFPSKTFIFIANLFSLTASVVTNIK